VHRPASSPQCRDQNEGVAGRGTVNLSIRMEYIDELDREKVLKARKSEEICVVMRPV
jgi:hypothetical protein